MSSEPRIIIFDIEVLNDLNEADKHWFELQSKHDTKTIKAQLNSVICFGWKVFGKNEPVNCINAWDYPKRWRKNENDDSELIKDAREVLANADAVVGHYSKGFDWSFMQTRIFRHGLPFLNPKTPHVDTKQLAANLSLVSHKLDNVSEFLLGERKMKHEGRQLWLDVRARKREAMNKMERYCKKDVLLTEGDFRVLRPFATGIPNHNLFVPGDTRLCPSCGSTRLQRRGWHYTATKIYKRYWCQDCGKWPRTDGADRNPR